MDGRKVDSIILTLGHLTWREEREEIRTLLLSLKSKEEIDDALRYALGRIKRAPSDPEMEGAIDTVREEIFR